MPASVPLRVSRLLSVLCWLLANTLSAGTTASVLRTNDVIAFIGGEDVVAMQQHGYVELFLARRTGELNLRFRNLGWEGDTVFEQRRDLNFPSWEQTLNKVGATVIVAQFGQAESLHGRAGLPEFTQAAEKFLLKLASTNRRLVLLAPTPFESSTGHDLSKQSDDLALYAAALRELGDKHGWHFVNAFPAKSSSGNLTRDGLHLNATGHWLLAREIAGALGESNDNFKQDPHSGAVAPLSGEQFRQAILTKNRLWFDYWRPQNWAFLAGDRTEQPSSRDHRDPKVRWFPQEMEQFVPLIEAKEREAKELAAMLPKSNSKTDQ